MPISIPPFPGKEKLRSREGKGNKGEGKRNERKRHLKEEGRSR